MSAGAAIAEAGADANKNASKGQHAFRRNHWGVFEITKLMGYDSGEKEAEQKGYAPKSFRIRKEKKTADDAADACNTSIQPKKH